MVTKTSAIKSIKTQISEIKKLKQNYSRSANHIKWVLNTLCLLKDIFGQNSRFYLSFESLNWKASGTFISNARNYETDLKRKNNEAYLNDLEVAQGLLESGINQIKLKGINNVYDGKDTPAESSEIIKILFLIERKLRATIRKIPTYESEIQDALENLFIGVGLNKEFSREKETIEYSSKSYIPDFTFKRINTILEVKLCKTADKEKRIISEINDDIVAYKTKYENLIFVVYDLGMIRDIFRFKSSLESNEHVIVRVVKH